jgi:pyrimidine operon attenuation protein/uracil phosphoribosyltransferase
MEKSLLLNASEIEKKIERMAYEVVERHFTEKSIYIVGIAGYGAAVAKKLHGFVSTITKVPCEYLEIEMDKEVPEGTVKLTVGTTAQLKNKNVILVDDVMNSGRTLMHGAAFLVNYKIHRLSTAVLIERKHRRFPIKADFVGMKLSTTLQEHVDVSLSGKKASVTIS